jgi:hypothetical protein
MSNTDPTKNTTQKPKKMSNTDPTPFARFGIIKLMTIMMKTLKQRLNVYTKYILMGWGFCLYLEFLNMCRLILNKKKYSGL